MSIEYLTFLQIAVTLIVGGILWQQIRSQKSVIETHTTLINNLKTYTDIINPAKIKEYHDLAKELSDKATLSKVDIEVHNFFKEQYAVIGERFDELASFAAAIMQEMSQEERDNFIKNNLPHCEALFKVHYEGKTKGGFFHNLGDQPLQLHFRYS